MRTAQMRYGSAKGLGIKLAFMDIGLSTVAVSKTAVVAEFFAGNVGVSMA
jgi:hypothetical protein